LVREEFGLQAEGENRRMQPLRPGLSGFMAAMKTRETEQGMSVTRPFQFLVRCRLALSFIFFRLISYKPLHLVLTGQAWPR
jgi:hypothetical protein